jgi:hypothetical protein
LEQPSRRWNIPNDPGLLLAAARDKSAFIRNSPSHQRQAVDELRAVLRLGEYDRSPSPIPVAD